MNMYLMACMEGKQPQIGSLYELYAKADWDNLLDSID